MKHFGHQSKRQQRKLVAHFRTVSKNFVLLLASVLQYTPNLSWTIQRTLLWVLSVWTLFGVCVNSLTQKRRRLLGILQQLQIPYRLTWTWWTQSTVVYMRLDLMHSQFDIGATEATVFDREQSGIDWTIFIVLHVSPSRFVQLTCCLQQKQRTNACSDLSTIGRGSIQC